MRRAAISVSANIAEGAGRGDGFFRTHLRISAGSAAELESEIRIARDLGYLDRADTESLLEETDAVRRMLWRLINAQPST